jgi:hypothetical protein
LRISPAASRVKVSARVCRGSAVSVSDPVGDPSGEHPGLARSGAGDHRDETGFGGDRGALVGVQIGDQGVRIHTSL